MKKALITALFLVPFLSLANIFTDGTVTTHPSEPKDMTYLRCQHNSYIIWEGWVEGHLVEAFDTYPACAPHFQDYADNEWMPSAPYGCEVTVIGYKAPDQLEATYQSNSYCNGSTVTIRTNVKANPTMYDTPHSCPPDSNPEYTYGVDTTDNGVIDTCGSPQELNLKDSCNSASGNTVLNVQVTEQNACYSFPDGSVCEYQAVDVGAGNQVYEMNLEGDCYSEPKEDVTNNLLIGQQPVNECVNNGGLLVCPADPDIVCSGGSCQEGCGYVNDAFVCYDIDTDSDGLPDYNDPDIDGDGIKNEDDLDSDGDGKDDPIDQNPSSGSGGNTTVNVDMSGVISELQKANQSLDNMENLITGTGVADTPDQDNRLTTLNNDYQNQLDNFIAKGSNELGYTDKLTFTNEGKLVAIVPQDGCQSYSIPVGIFGNFDINLCEVSAKIKPILAVLFGIMTAFYVFFRVNSTLRGDN